MCLRARVFGFWDVVNERMRRGEEEYEALVYEWYCVNMYLGVKRMNRNGIAFMHRQVQLVLAFFFREWSCCDLIYL